MSFFKNMKDKYAKFQESQLKAKEKKVAFLKKSNKINSEYNQLKDEKRALLKKGIDGFNDSMWGDKDYLKKKHEEEGERVKSAEDWLK